MTIPPVIVRPRPFFDPAGESSGYLVWLTPVRVTTAERTNPMDR